MHRKLEGRPAMIQADFRTRGFHVILIIIAFGAQTGTVQAENGACDKVFVPCPRAEGFQFFNKTCYGVIRDTLPFGAGDAYFKCQSGMHLSFSHPSMHHHYTKMEHRSGLDLRMTLARVNSRGTLNTLTKLQRQVVQRPTETTLVGLACSHDCASPAGWMFSGSEAHLIGGLGCSETPFCNWQRSSSSAWARPPGSAADPPAPDEPVWMPDVQHNTSASTKLSNRLAVLAAPGALLAAPQTLELYSVACEIPYRTTDDGVQQLMARGIATEADLSLHAQMVRELTVRPAGASLTRVQLSWLPPHCDVTTFYVTVLSDADDGQNRTQVSAADVCGPDQSCQLQVDLPPCSLVYVQVGAILSDEEDTAPDVVQWQTPALADPPTPEKFYISEISGSVVTLTWESPAVEGPCRPHHEVTVQGHGKVTLEPGVAELKADLGSYCAHFNASVMATILGRNSSVRGPIQGVTGPTAPDSVEVRATGTRWSSLHWSRTAGPISPCVLAKYRVDCWPTPPRRRPLVTMTSLERQLNVSGLAPGARYRCGVCALASLSDSALATASLAVAPCGDVRFVELATNETTPGSPSGVNVTVVSHDGLTLEWWRPEEPNGVIVRYNVSVRCEQQTFPLCSSDPLCTDRSFVLTLGGNDTDHVTFAVTGLQAARRHHVTVAAATEVGPGPFSAPARATTRSGVPPPPRQVVVTSRVKTAVGQVEQTSVSVSLRPPCPYPGRHGYRLQFERVDFLAGYRSTVRSGGLSRSDIQHLYSGQRNISFSVFDGKWTPGFNYRVRIVALSENDALGAQARTPSAPINFTMNVPPPGEVRSLTADCSEPLKLSFRWSNPTEHAFGIVSYRSRYRCRQLVTGREVASSRWHSCRHTQCPCVSSQRSTDQCRACERVCNYPVKQFNFMGRRTYYFNCTCERRVRETLVAPGSLCHVAVQAVSRYHQKPGSPTLASCQTPPHTPRVTGLKVACGQERLSASWAVPRPLEVTTKAYHVTIQRNSSGSDRPENFTRQTLRSSQCEKARCEAEWPDLDGDVTYLVRVAAESVYSSPPVGPISEASCRSPPRVPRPPSDDLEKLAAESSGWRPDLDPSRQYLLRLPSDLYDLASGALREMRVVVSESVGNNSTAGRPSPSSGNVSELQTHATWRQFSANQSGSYQASPPAFVPADVGGGQMEFVLGGDPSCSTEPVPEQEVYCNGPLRPNTSYTLRLVFVNGAGFASSRPFTFRTKSVMEAERTAAGRVAAASGRQSTLGQTGRVLGRLGPTAGDWLVVGRSGDGAGPKQPAAADGGRGAVSVRPTTAATVNTTAAGGSSARPDAAVNVPWTVVGVSLGSLLGIVSACVGVFCWRRCRGGES